jgi:tetratricopeptide (TPR) repeat protein
VAVACSVYMWNGVRLDHSLLRQWAMSDVYPEEAVKYLKAMGSPKRVLNYYNWGGYIILHAPEFKLFYDGRANTLYDEAIYKDYHSFLRGRVSPERLARYPADVALLPQSGFVSALRKFPSPWRMVYQDWNFILLPPDSSLEEADLPDPSEVLPNGIQPLLSQAFAAAEQGRIKKACEPLEKAIQIDPQAARAYGLLAQYYARLGRFDDIAELIERGIRESPRRRNNLRSQEGNAYLLGGKPRLALAAYRQSISKSPFSNPLPQLQRIKEIERSLAREKRGY